MDIGEWDDTGLNDRDRRVHTPWMALHNTSAQYSPKAQCTLRIGVSDDVGKVRLLSVNSFIGWNSTFNNNFN